MHNCTSDPDEGGDPACWAHLFDDPEDGAVETDPVENEVGQTRDVSRG
jgi:hypothetical protein